MSSEKPRIRPARIWRNVFPLTEREVDPESPGILCTMHPGGVGVEHDLIKINEDDEIVISPAATAEDVIAFVLGCIRDDPRSSASVKNRLGSVLDMMDEEARVAHGFDYSPLEKQHEWTKIEGLFLEATAPTKH